MERVLISGGSRGIGAALVRAFVQNGDAVTFLYRESKAAADAVSAETGAVAIQCDVGDPAAVKTAVAAATAALGGAPTVLVVLADANNANAVADGSLVMGNLMNAAHAMGLGSCWINRAKELFAMPEGKALLEKWGIEGDYIGVGNCILGYADEAPEIKPRKDNYIYYVL